MGRAGIVAAVLVVTGAAPTPPLTSKSLRFAKKALFVNPYESATVGDLDRDGHLDIVYGAHWLAGPDFVPRAFRPNHTSKDYLRANSDHVWDVDKDGWPDIIAGGWGEDGIYCEAVETPVAVKPDTHLRRIARARGWRTERW